MPLAGYDLSDYQTVGQGADRDFAIVKASEGKGVRMTRHDSHVAGLRVAGRLVGHYHFAWPENGGQADAANFLAAAKAKPGDVLALDWEPYRQTAVTPAMAFPYLRDFATAVYSSTGAWPWFYTNDDWLTRIRSAVSAADWAWLTDRLPLWKAGVRNLYVSDPSKGPGETYGFRAVACFQWTEAPLDQDVFYGDAQLWRAFGVPQEVTVARTTWRGVVVDERTARMLDAANALLPTIPFYPSQGSYSTAVGASGGTHAGGGAVDIKLNVNGRDLTDAEAREIETAMRRVGFAGYYRTALAGVWPRHVHGIAIGQVDLSSEAAQQVRDYARGRDGLLPRDSTGLSINPDTGTRAYVGTTWELYQSSEDPLAAWTEAQLISIMNATFINVARSPEFKNIIGSSALTAEAPWVDPNTGKVSAERGMTLGMWLAWGENTIVGAGRQTVRDILAANAGAGMRPEDLKAILDAIAADNDSLSDDDLERIGAKLQQVVADGVSVSGTLTVQPKDADPRVRSLASFTRAVEAGEYVPVPSFDLAAALAEQPQDADDGPQDAVAAH